MANLANYGYILIFVIAIPTCTCYLLGALHDHPQQGLQPEDPDG